MAGSIPSLNPHLSHVLRHMMHTGGNDRRAGSVNQLSSATSGGEVELSVPNIDAYMGVAADFGVMFAVVLATVIVVLMLSAAWGNSPLFATREPSTEAPTSIQSSNS